MQQDILAHCNRSMGRRGGVDAATDDGTDTTLY
jgi:hypothetical protein